ncbi:hypothetical protein H5410_025456 [Solanum commersonii]|uniref:F-box domain-containing protein n=1 Tax=Solanum commersonii TaxID=4109 RepID=A0A9J5YY06_SOLCO|nr:hypothetical protein H5410_025456 [Solanum commersonii]
MALRSVWQEELLIEIMVMIVKNVNIGDYVRMAAVCKSWRSMLSHQHVKSVDVEGPWLLQLKDCAYNHHTGFNFYSLSENRFYTFKFSSYMLNNYPKVAHGSTFCCATSNGWLVLVAGPNHNPDIFLFDPISEIDVKLPPLNTIPYFPYFEKHRIAYMINMVHVFSISDDSTKDLIVVANFVFARDAYSDDNVLGFCNCEEEEEDRSWVILDVDIPINRYESMLFHNDVLYTLVSNHNDDVDTFMGDVVFDKRIGDEINHVVVLKTDCCEVKMKIINIVKYNTALHIRPFDNELFYIAYSGLKYVHLAKSITGELLIIWNKTDPLSQHSEHDNDYDPNDQIYELDDDYYLSIYHTSKLVIERYEGTYKANTDFESITSLDDQALFVSAK